MLTILKAFKVMIDNKTGSGFYLPYLYRVCTGPGKPGKSWNFIVSFSRTGKSWKKATGPGKFWKCFKPKKK